MKILVASNFDGVMCVVLLLNIFGRDKSIKWVKYNNLKRAKSNVENKNIILKLFNDKICFLYLEYYHSNLYYKNVRNELNFYSSAARVIYNCYKDKFTKDFTELIFQVDKICSTNLSLDEILYPEKYNYLLLSIIVNSYCKYNDHNWSYLVNVLEKNDISYVMKKSEIVKECNRIIKINNEYEKMVINNTYCIANLSISDFRYKKKLFFENPFLVYGLFPECIINIKICSIKNIVIITATKNIIKPYFSINLGEIFAKFGGGGYVNEGMCCFYESEFEKYIANIISILLYN